MKPKLLREIALLMLPVLLIGGGAWWQSRGGSLPRLLSTGPIDSGPRRIEVTHFENLELSPLDVARGYDWGTTICTRESGALNLPKNWKPSATDLVFNVRFVYRLGKVWKDVPSPRKGPRLFLGSAPKYRVQVNWEGALADAEEVRMRGWLGVRHIYSGPIPAGWVPPRNLQISGANRILTLETKPFDMAIKAPEKPLPIPLVLKQTKLQLMNVKWLRMRGKQQDRQEFLLHLRHTEYQDWASRNACFVDNVHFFDADNQEILFFEDYGVGRRHGVNQSILSNQNVFSAQKLSSDIVLTLLSDSVTPQKSWDKIKQPIRLELEASDGTCWPLKVRALLRDEEGTDEIRKKFGAPVPP